MPAENEGIVLRDPPVGKARVQPIERATSFLAGEGVLAQLIKADPYLQLFAAPPLSDCAQTL